MGWDMHPICHIYNVLCLLRLQPKDPSPFIEAARERRTGDDVTREILELWAHIYLLHALEAYVSFEDKLTATCGKNWQHHLQHN
jgi:hypothetical protein